MKGFERRKNLILKILKNYSEIRLETLYRTARTKGFDFKRKTFYSDIEKLQQENVCGFKRYLGEKYNILTYVENKQGGA